MPKTLPNNTVEQRAINSEFRVSDDASAPTISGYAAIFDSASENIGWIETIDPHAFDSVLAKQPDVRCLFNHDASFVLGRTASKTLSLSIDARGLQYTCQPPDTQAARDLIVSMKRGDISQSSFGFICKRDQWTENSDGTVTRRILEFDELLDVSPVTYPAFSATTSQARSIPASIPHELRSKIALRSADMTDEEGDECECDCAQCVSGNCNLCSDDDCDDEQCSCYNQRSLISDSEHRKMSMRLALLK